MIFKIIFSNFTIAGRNLNAVEARRIIVKIIPTILSMANFFIRDLSLCRSRITSLELLFSFWLAFTFDYFLPFFLNSRNPR